MDEQLTHSGQADSNSCPPSFTNAPAHVTLKVANRFARLKADNLWLAAMKISPAQGYIAKL